MGIALAGIVLLANALLVNVLLVNVLLVNQESLARPLRHRSTSRKQEKARVR